jgi:hypothetical protein
MKRLFAAQESEQKDTVRWYLKITGIVLLFCLLAISFGLLTGDDTPLFGWLARNGLGTNAVRSSHLRTSNVMADARTFAAALHYVFEKESPLMPDVTLTLTASSMQTSTSRRVPATPGVFGHPRTYPKIVDSFDDSTGV